MWDRGLQEGMPNGLFWGKCRIWELKGPYKWSEGPYDWFFSLDSLSSTIHFLTHVPRASILTVPWIIYSWYLLKLQKIYVWWLFDLLIIWNICSNYYYYLMIIWNICSPCLQGYKPFKNIDHIFLFISIS